jgi:hypothetical protein
MESTTPPARTYKVRNSAKCFRFKPDAFFSHAPDRKGIYELVTFDDAQNARVLFVGAAFDATIQKCLEGHADGTRAPAANELLAQYPNLYFDYLEEMNARTIDDAQDIYWWLVQKHRPPFNDVAAVKPSDRPGGVDVVDLG